MKALVGFVVLVALVAVAAALAGIISAAVAELFMWGWDIIR